jgi:hypothetical protein
MPKKKEKLREKIKEKIEDVVASSIDPCYQCPYADDCEGCWSQDGY